MYGASVVPDRLIATTGSVSSNSATPPLLGVFGAVWFAITSTATSGRSGVSVGGSTFVGAAASESPRYPMMPGTPDQSSFAGQAAMLVQSCAVGEDCAGTTASALAATPTVQT